MKIGEDHINLDQQVLILMKCHLLLKRWWAAVSSLETMIQLGGMLHGLGEGMMLMMGQQSMVNRINWINMMLEPCKLRNPIDTEHQHECVEHRDNVDWMI